MTSRKRRTSPPCPPADLVSYLPVDGGAQRQMRMPIAMTMFIWLQLGMGVLPMNLIARIRAIEQDVCAEDARDDMRGAAGRGVGGPGVEAGGRCRIGSIAGARTANRIMGKAMSMKFQISRLPLPGLLENRSLTMGMPEKSGRLAMMMSSALRTLAQFQKKAMPTASTE